MAVFPPSMPPPRRTEPLRRAATAALVAAVAGPTLWLGGAPPGAAVLAALLSVTALGLLVASDGGRLVVPPLAAVPLAVAALCALQLVPLPPGLLAVLSPPMAELRAYALVPLGLDGWRPLSHDPPATAAALAGSLAAAAALVASAGLCRSRTRRRILAAGIGLTGVAVALIGFGHALADASTLFGLHRFQNSQLPFLTPFGNPNHLAAFATLASTLLLGLAADTSQRPRQALWLAGAVACGASAFLSLSRGGIAFWCAGQLAFLLLMLRRRDVRGTDGRAIPVALALGTVALVVGYLALDRIGARMATVDSLEKIQSSKVDLWPMFSRPALAAWLTGLGRGTFALAFPRWQTAHSSLVFTFEYPENLPLQLATELGLPATVGLIALAAWATVRTARGATAPLVLAAFAGVGALVLHDLFDFALELPACATAAAVALGIASGPWVEEHGQTLRRAPTLAALGLGAVLVVFGLVRGADSASRAEARLAAHVLGSPGTVRDEARALVDRHPADAILYRTAGWTEASRPGGQPRVALAWLEPLALPPAAGPGHPPRRRPRLVPARCPRPGAGRGAARARDRRRHRDHPRRVPSPGARRRRAVEPGGRDARARGFARDRALETESHRGRARAPRPGAARLRRPPRGRRAHRHRRPHPPADRRPGRRAASCSRRPRRPDSRSRSPAPRRSPPSAAAPRPSARSSPQSPGIPPTPRSPSPSPGTSSPRVGPPWPAPRSSASSRSSAPARGPASSSPRPRPTAPRAATAARSIWSRPPCACRPTIPACTARPPSSTSHSSVRARPCTRSRSPSPSPAATPTRRPARGWTAPDRDRQETVRALELPRGLEALDAADAGIQSTGPRRAQGL